MDEVKRSFGEIDVCREARIKKLVIGGDPENGVAGTELDANAIAELSSLNGLTASVAELNILDGVTASADELNLCDLSAVGGLVKVKKLPIAAAPTGAEQDTGWDLPAKGVVLDVLVDVTAAEATGGTKTLDVGLLSSEGGGDANGFAAALSVASTGTKRPTYALDGGGAYFATTTRGELLAKLIAGAGTDDRGLYREFPHLINSVAARSVTYTAKSADWVEFRGSIYVLYIEIA